MAASAPDSESSLSSSGYEDGLGRRVLEFDREAGTMLERLVLRPELTAFEKVLQERLEIVAGLDDERFARPRAIERGPGNRLTVISEYVAGRRLSDILESAADHGIVAGLDAGLGLLLELFPAVARLHDAGLAHGTLAPGRVLITPAGQLLLLDALYAQALEKLQLTRKRLWSEMRLAFPPTAGAPRFDQTADLSHSVMIAAAMIVGRPLRDEEYPDGIAPLRQEIAEIASIRGAKAFATGIDKFVAGMLPVVGKRPSGSADEAAIDLRKLVRNELGINTCRTAMLEFFQQIDSADAERLAAEAAEYDQQIRRQTDRAAEERAEAARREADRPAREREEAARKERERLEAERKEKERLEAERKEQERLAKERAAAERREQERLEAERKERERLERERLEAERKEKERLERERLEAERRERERVEAERRERERLEAERREKERLERERLEAERREKERLEAERKERERLEAERRERERLEAERREKERLERERLEAERREKERLEAERKERERLEAERRQRERLEAERREAERLERERLEAERREKARLEAERREKERLEAELRERERLEAERRERERLEAARRERERLEAERLEREHAEAEQRERELLEAARLERERAEAARRERERFERQRREQEERARREEEERARQEKAARERAQREREQRERDEGEREERERAAAAGMAAAPQPDAGGWLVPPERAASFEPVVPEAPLPPPTARAYPIYEPPPEPPSWSADTVPSPAEPQFEIAPVAGGRQTAPAGPLDIPAGPRAKTEPIKIKTDSYAPVFETPARADLRHEPEDMSAAGAYEPFGYTKERPPVPWKLIAAGIVLIAITFGATRWYAPIEGPIVETAKKVASKVQPKPATAPPVVSALTGQIVVKTDPSGLKVLLDGKVAGDSPLTIDNVAPGRHVITLVGSGGLLKRTVKVDSAKEALLDVPIFAGFASIAAPFVVQVTESGKVIGTSENEIILGPGRHDLVLSNADLAYTATQSVEIQPGEATRVKIDPRGRANINALPWAEVWIDGEKAGETPLGNLPIRLGVREIVFKNPQFPDRRIVTTIKADAPATITVDFNKDK